MSLFLLLLAAEIALPRQLLPKTASEQTSKAADAYWTCVLTKSAHFEKSHESPDVIARTAKTSCQFEQTEFLILLDVDFSEVSQTVSDASPETPVSISNSFEDRLTAEAEKLVVEARARAAQ